MTLTTTGRCAGLLPTTAVWSLLAVLSCTYGESKGEVSESVQACKEAPLLLRGCLSSRTKSASTRSFTESRLLWTLSSSLLPRVKPSHLRLTSSFLLSSLPLFPSPIVSFKKREGEKLPRCRGKWWGISGSGDLMFPSTPPINASTLMHLWLLCPACA